MATRDGQPVESDFFEVIGTQRAMRRLKPDPVPEELIKQLIWAATRAPNGGNRQPWRFLVITAPETKKRIQELYLNAWEQYAKSGYTGTPRGMSPEAAAANERVVRSAQHLAEHVHEAPVLILACAFGQGPNQGIASGSSIYPAVQNLMLAARAIGLGTTLTTLHRWHEDEVRKLLGIPDTVETAALIPVGWPEGRFGAGPRLPVEAVTYWDRWGAKRT
jgi:nitroreductase